MASSGSKLCKPMKTYTESLFCWKKKGYTWTVLLRLVFLDNEYSSEVFQTLLAVSHFITLHEKARNSRPEVLQIKGVFQWTLRHFQEHIFYRTPPVAASEKPKAEAVVRRCSVKKLFLEILLNSQKKLVPASLFFSLGNAACEFCESHSVAAPHL